MRNWLWKRQWNLEAMSLSSSFLFSFSILQLTHFSPSPIFFFFFVFPWIFPLFRSLTPCLGSGNGIRTVSPSTRWRLRSSAPDFYGALATLQPNTLHTRPPKTLFILLWASISSFCIRFYCNLNFLLFTWTVLVIVLFWLICVWAGNYFVGLFFRWVLVET